MRQQQNSAKLGGYKPAGRALRQLRELGQFKTGDGIYIEHWALEGAESVLIKEWGYASLSVGILSSFFLLPEPGKGSFKTIDFAKIETFFLYDLKASSQEVSG